MLRSHAAQAGDWHSCEGLDCVHLARTKDSRDWKPPLANACRPPHAMPCCLASVCVSCSIKEQLERSIGILDFCPKLETLPVPINRSLNSLLFLPRTIVTSALKGEPSLWRIAPV